MFASPLTRIPRRLFIGFAAVTLLLAVVVTPSATANPPTNLKPTVVLVHGAFADASGFNDVTAGLQKRGYTVYDYLRVFLSTIWGRSSWSDTPTAVR